MTIENRDLYMQSLPDWAILDGCFGQTRIRPTDIDGCVERNGVALFLEHKSTPTTPIKTGQRILFEALAASGHAVIAFWTDGGDRNVVKMLVFWRGKSEERNPATLDDLRASVSKWYAWANAQIT